MKLLNYDNVRDAYKMAYSVSSRALFLINERPGDMEPIADLAGLTGYLDPLTAPPDHLIELHIILSNMHHVAAMALIGLQRGQPITSSDIETSQHEILVGLSRLVDATEAE